MTRRLLVTTALEQTWGDGAPILFAGEWCRLYDRSDAWSVRQHEVLAYHWSDRAKLARDHSYLNELQESLLVHLTPALNAYHNLERPLRYWRMVLGVWLPTYVAVLFDRWECLRLAFERAGAMDTIALPPPEADDPPRDGDAFINSAAYSAEWNHRLCLRIIQRAHAAQCAIQPTATGPVGLRGEAGGPPGAGAAPRRSIAKRALRALLWQADSLAGFFFRSYKVVFVSSYFPPVALLRLNLALGQVPRLHAGDFAYPAAGARAGSAANDRRDALRIARVAASEFEVFLTERIVRDMPRAYLEDFAALLNRVRQIRVSTRVICSAVAHWGNELFKLWCAEQLLKGTRFVALTHGGAIPVSIDQTMYFEEKVSDRKVTWSIPFLPNHVRLPPNKMVGKRVSSSKTICAVITQETPLYPFRASEGPIGIGVLEVVPLVCGLFARLRGEIQACFRVKPYRNLGWNTRQRISDVIGADRIFTGQSYERCLAQSRLVICTYPETTFAEAMASGLPTLLVYSSHLWQTIPRLEGLIATLRSAGILYDDPLQAADHVNRIWADADGWWSSAAVVAARQQFCACCLDLDNGWLNRWAGFLRECAA